MNITRLAEGLGPILWLSRPDPHILQAWARDTLPWTEDELQAFLYGTVLNINQQLFRPITKMEMIYTEGCNLACTYCFEGRKERPIHMTRQVARKAVDLLLDYAGEADEVQITHFGGEPLLRWHLIKECIEYASAEAQSRGKRVRHQMTTNGTLLTEDIARFMLAHRLAPLISLDGLALTHDRFRRDRFGRPSFERVMAGIQAVRKVHNWVAVKVTVMPESVRTLVDDIEGLAALGINYFIIGHATGRLWSDPEVDAFSAAMQTLHEWYQCNRSERLKIEYFEKPARKAPVFGCQAGIRAITVAPSGQISSCAKVFGLNKRKLLGLLGDVWLGLYCLDQRREFHQCIELRNNCRRFGIYEKYRGGCFASNYEETGDLYTPSHVDMRFAETRASL